jgi:hypothetical protein
MKLIENWRDVLLKAWSIKWIAGAVLLSGIEVVLPFFTDVIPTGIFAALSGVVASTALLARILAQPVKEDKDGEAQ